MESLSEDTGRPVEEIREDVSRLYAENDALFNAIQEKNEFIQKKRQLTAALLMEKNWYAMVTKRIEEVSNKDDRLEKIREVLAQ